MFSFPPLPTSHPTPSSLLYTDPRTGSQRWAVNRTPSSIMKCTTLDESLRSTSLGSTYCSSCSSANKSVEFDDVEIREYDVIPGDNPSVSVGPAISIGWNYDKERTARIPVEDYETVRGPRRSQKQMLLPCYVRMERLNEHGVSMHEISTATEETDRARYKRDRTVAKLKYSRLEEIMESAARKTKRLLHRRQRDSVKWEIWKEKFETMQKNQLFELKCLLPEELYSSLDGEGPTKSTFFKTDDQPVEEKLNANVNEDPPKNISLCPIVAEEEDDEIFPGQRNEKSFSESSNLTVRHSFRHDVTQPENMRMTVNPLA